MDMPNQPNPQSPNSQYPQTVVIVGKQKSVGVAFILAFFFGPLGLLYASITGGVVMFILGVIISIVTLGIGLILVWITCIIWAVVAANNANSKISPSTGVNINMGVKQPQQPVCQTISPSASQPISQPIAQQPSHNLEAQSQYIQTKQQEAQVEKNNDLSLETFSNWVINNKKGLVFGLGGIVIILVLIVAVKFVFNLDFSKHHQNNIVFGKPDSAKMDSAKMDSAKVVNVKIDNNSGIYPQSSERLLTLNDLTNLNKQDLRIMRNEIFARHGYIFKTADMKQYFNQQNWYKPIYNDVTDQLSSIEKTNVEFIKSYER